VSRGEASRQLCYSAIPALLGIQFWTSSPAFYYIYECKISKLNNLLQPDQDAVLSLESNNSLELPCSSLQTGSRPSSRALSLLSVCETCSDSCLLSGVGLSNESLSLWSSLRCDAGFLSGRVHFRSCKRIPAGSGIVIDRRRTRPDGVTTRDSGNRQGG
jgi:hypothetical protein